MATLQASPALVHRERPTRVEPVKVNGAAATPRVIYSLEGGEGSGPPAAKTAAGDPSPIAKNAIRGPAEAACTFHLTRQDPDPASVTSSSVSHWQIAAITPDDTS